ncbi:MAG: ATP-dependent DNA helicase [Candidatus Bathycorpusculaceae bacterium]
MVEKSLKKAFVCRQCGKTYSIEDYEESHFCKRCGTLLTRMYSNTSKFEAKVDKEADFEKSVKEFFPYRNFRPFQLDAIKFNFDIIKNGKIGLLSSPCGTGKSISVLTAFFMAKEWNNSVGRLLALTRTKNQLEIYCRELKNIREHHNVSFVASVFKSKKEICPYIMEDPKFGDISYRDFLYYCKGLKEGAFGKTCKYYERTYSGWKPSWHAYAVINKIREVGPLMPDEVYAICAEKEICPYEATKILAKYADVLIGNYNYLLVDSVRGSILGKAGWRINDVNCVFDEAHSLPYYAAGIFSDELSSTSVRRALKEVETFGLDDYGFFDALYNVMIKLGKKIYREYGADSEHIVGKNAIIDVLSKELKFDADKLIDLISDLSEKGEIIRYKRAELGKSPISYLSRCAGFLSDWVSLTGSSYVRYVNVGIDRDGRKSVRIGIRCVDPALAASVINKLRSAILMSGTLWHMNYYMDVLGIERKRCETMELPSPFPTENRLILVDKAVTTKFEKRNQIQWKRIAEHLKQIIKKIDGRIAVYFPSYEVMQEIANIAKFDLPFLMEQRGTAILDVLQFLKDNERCVVFGVARGKISEGVDMSTGGRSMLSAVVVVGLPYPKKTELQAAVYEYFREKFGDKAIEYANDIPCLNALAQSAGRLLRSPEDKGVILIMDGRAAGKFKHKLPNEWKHKMKTHWRIEKILDRIENFYKVCEG